MSLLNCTNFSHSLFNQGNLFNNTLISPVRDDRIIPALAPPVYDYDYSVRSQVLREMVKFYRTHGTGTRNRNRSRITLEF